MPSTSSLRRNDYNGEELEDQRPRSRFWYRHGFGLAGLVALVVGTAAASLFLDTSLYIGPLSAALDGADLSVFVGPIVAGVIYATAVVAGRRRIASDQHARAAQNSTSQVNA